MYFTPFEDSTLNSLPFPNAFYRTVRRDHRCLWFRHLPGPLAARLATLAPDTPIALLLRRVGDSSRGAPTLWMRMRPGRDGRTTQGVRIIDGVPLFEAIPLGTEIELGFADTDATIASAAKSFQPPVSPIHPQGGGVVLPTPEDRRGPLFGAYLIADYSGAEDCAVQRRSIRVALGTAGQIDILPGPFTRTSLVRDLVARLVAFTRRGIRALVGIDHQYGIPAALAAEVGLNGLSWRHALARLYAGDYGAGNAGPRWEHPRRFAAAFNALLREQGRPDYFWSATKRTLYGLRHGSNPRADSGNPSVFRLTELCRGIGNPAIPKPLSRVGDNGSVGCQSCCGMGHLLEVLQACEQEKVPVAVWPMDGLDIRSAAYAGKHVFAEPYPSAKRGRAVLQTDENDARESVRFLWEKDQRGELPAICDLSTLTPEEARRVQFEGWIIAHLPWNRVN